MKSEEGGKGVGQNAGLGGGRDRESLTQEGQVLASPVLQTCPNAELKEKAQTARSK